MTTPLYGQRWHPTFASHFDWRANAVAIEDRTIWADARTRRGVPHDMILGVVCTDRPCTMHRPPKPDARQRSAALRRAGGLFDVMATGGESTGQGPVYTALLGVFALLDACQGYNAPIIALCETDGQPVPGYLWSALAASCHQLSGVKDGPRRSGEALDHLRELGPRLGLGQIVFASKPTEGVIHELASATWSAAHVGFVLCQDAASLRALPDRPSLPVNLTPPPRRAFVQASLPGFEDL